MWKLVRRIVVLVLASAGAIAGVSGTIPGAVGVASATPTGGAYTPLTPTRVCDTRGSSTLSGNAAQCQGRTLAANTAINVSLAGFVAAGTTAVVVNVTAVNAAAAGYLTVYPAGQPRPTASNLNFTAKTVVANLVEVGLGTGGQISIYTTTRSDVVVDLQGYVSATAPVGTGSGLYDPLPSPVRICDTRLQPGSPAQCNNGHPIPAGGRATINVAGNLPTAAIAVVANVTAVSPAGAGYLTVYPDGANLPTASNLNYIAGQVIPNRATVALGSGGAIDVYSSQATNVVVDISGYYTAAGGTGAIFVPASSPVPSAIPGQTRA